MARRMPARGVREKLGVELSLSGVYLRAGTRIGRHGLTVTKEYSFRPRSRDVRISRGSEGGGGVDRAQEIKGEAPALRCGILNARRELCFYRPRIEGIARRRVCVLFVHFRASEYFERRKEAENESEY